MTETENPTPLQISQALADASGAFPAAAAMLGVSEKSLEHLVDNDAALRKRWREKAKVPPSTSLISRDEDSALAEAIRKEEERFKKGLAGIGLSDKARNLAVACQQLQRSSANSLLAATSGGIAKAFFDTLEEIEKISHRLENLDVPAEQVVAYESILREDRAKLLDVLYKYASKVDQGVMIQAKIQKMFGAGGQGGKPEKPGFKPLAKPVDVESHVVEPPK
jgi:hypothetical protein